MLAAWRCDDKASMSSNLCLHEGGIRGRLSFKRVQDGAAGEAGHVCRLCWLYLLVQDGHANRMAVRNAVHADDPCEGGSADAHMHACVWAS